MKIFVEITVISQTISQNVDKRWGITFRKKKTIFIRIDIKSLILPLLLPRIIIIIIVIIIIIIIIIIINNLYSYRICPFSKALGVLNKVYMGRLHPEVDR